MSARRIVLCTGSTTVLRTSITDFIELDLYV
nr:MAG TPA: FAD-NAD(P)-binding [Caudoviricetes sp.]